MSVTGAQDVINRLHAMSEKASRQTLRDALRKGAEPIRAAAEAHAKRGPGAPDLADHIAISSGRASGDQEAVLLVGPTKEERSDQPGKTFDTQAIFLEYGTSDTEAQPFMRPALDQEADASESVVIAELWRQITEAIR